MLAYFLALAVGLGSIALYLVAFFFPEIHRKNDFIWSGVGFFYALVLWVFARRITGGLLLGHVASVALLGWFGWQTFSLRRQLTPQAQQTQIPDTQIVKATIQAQVNKLSLTERFAQFQTSLAHIFSSVKDKAQQTVSKKKSEISKNTVTAKPVDRHVASPAQTVTSTNSETTLSKSEPPTPEVTSIDTPAKTQTEENTPEVTSINTPAKTQTEENTLPVVNVVAPEAKAPPENIPPTTPTEG